MISVTLYTRAGCGLCDEARQMLDTIGQEIPLELREIDIEGDRMLEQAYFDRIPVLSFGGQQMAAPIAPDALAGALWRLHNRLREGQTI